MLEPKGQNKYMFTKCKRESQEKKDEKHLDCHRFFPPNSHCIIVNSVIVVLKCHLSLSLLYLYIIHVYIFKFKALKYSESPHFTSALKSYLIVLGQAALTKHIP